MRHGDLRASDADRERVIALLRDAAHEGRIATEELDERVATVLKARTYRDLDATTADLPASTTSSGRMPQRRRGAAVWTFEVVRANPFLLVVAIPLVAAAVSLLFAAAIMWLVVTAVVLALGGDLRRGPLTAFAGHRGHRHHQRRHSVGY